MTLQFPTGLLVPKDWKLGATFYTPAMMFALPETYEAPHSPIKDQGQCGSCSHFASIACYESVLMRKNGGQVVDLSEQSVLDCAAYDNYKCQGSFFHGRHLVEKGAPLDKDDPYQGRASNACKNLPSAFEKPVSHAFVGRENGWPSETEIRQALVEKGALWVTVYADQSWNTPGEILRQGGRGRSNHAVTCVGYKPDPQNAGKYLFKIKNSWGARWNNGGYVWLPYGVSNFGETAAFVELAKAPEPGPNPGPDPGPNPGPGPGPNPGPGPGPGPQPDPDPTPDPCVPANLMLPQRIRVTSGHEVLVGVKPQQGYSYKWYEMNADGSQGREIASGSAFYFKPTKDVFLKVIANNTCGIAECTTEIELARGVVGFPLGVPQCEDCE